MTDTFPGGWREGDACYLITSRAKGTVAVHTVESFDGRYFGVRGSSGLFHHASPGRMFRSKEEAAASLEQSQNSRAPADSAMKKGCAR